MRNAIARARGHIERPSIVVGPNKPVLRQWRDTFIRNGFPPERLQLFRPGQDNVDFQSSGVVLLADRYALQSELKSIFDEISKIKFDSPYPDPDKVLASCVRKTSVLWPSLSRKGLFGLWLQYLADKGTLRDYKVKNSVRDDKEYPSDCVTRLVSGALNTVEQNRRAVFETAIFDEVRFSFV